MGRRPDVVARLNNSVAGSPVSGSITAMSSPAPQPQPLESASFPGLASLDAASVEAVARRVAELLREPAQAPLPQRLVDAKTLAAELGVDRSWVYAHRDELSHVRLGAGSKGRLRFDLQAARQALAKQQTAGLETRAPGTDIQAPQRRARRHGRSPARNGGSTPGSVLRVRGGSGSGSSAARADG